MWGNKADKTGYIDEYMKENREKLSGSMTGLRSP